MKTHKLAYYPEAGGPHTALRAHDLLRRAEAATPWRFGTLYPVGGAAEPLLLYLLLRTLNELPVRHVLELGAGQTTRLLDGWAGAAPGRRFTTFEHDPWWARTVRDGIAADGGEVLDLPLEPTETPSGTGAWYAPPPPGTLPEGGVNLVVVDGPVGVSRFSRYGIVPHLAEWLADDWSVIWDDLHRPGDVESFAAFIDRLRTGGVPHDHRVLDGVRRVGIVYSPSFVALQYMW